MCNSDIMMPINNNNMSNSEPILDDSKRPPGHEEMIGALLQSKTHFTVNGKYQTNLFTFVDQ